MSDDQRVSRILIVDDDRPTAELQRRRLTRSGYDAICASTLGEALTELSTVSIDLMVIDYLLSDDLNGLEFFQQAQQQGVAPPTILVTGFSKEEIVVQALRAGIRDFVIKSTDYLDYLPHAVRQVLEKVEAERRLVASEARKTAMLISALDAIITMDEQSRIVEFNPAAETMFGRSRDEVLGRRVPELFVRLADRQYFEQRLDQYLATGSEFVFGRRVEAVALRADGAEFSVELSAAVTGLQGERLFTAYVRDITDRKRLEEQIRQSQKLEAVGRLAGGVAHDFNNLLTIILGNARCARQDLSAQSGQLHELIKEISEAAERAADLTLQLLAFSRQQVLEPQACNLNRRAVQLEGMLRRLIGNQISLVTRLASDLALVEVDPGQIDRILLNLAVNARDAMREGGTLLIETSNVVLDVCSVGSAYEVPPGDYVKVSVSDTGCGMSREVLTHLFEPFFTTKPLGQGTGLGLAMVFGIVKQSGGYITVYSELARGTAFHLYFPRRSTEAATNSALAEEAIVQEEILPPPGGAETILLVEDERRVRRLAGQFLREAGYTVLEASNGEEVLRFATDTSSPELSLLITDVIMPGMNGREVASHVLQRHSCAKILFMSGYTADAVAIGGLLEVPTGFLQKPFSRETLLRKVREVLDS